MSENEAVNYKHKGGDIFYKSEVFVAFRSELMRPERGGQTIMGVLQWKTATQRRWSVG